MASKLTANEIDGFERRLRKLLERVIGDADKVEAQVLQPSGDPDGQREDENVEESAFERDYEALAAQDTIAQEAREALARIVEGTYGVCETCGRPIGRERLSQVPWARECAEDARKHGSMYETTDEFSSGGWFEGWKEALEKPKRASPCLRPRTWLLKKGWKKRGLIGFEESPRSGIE